MGIKLGSKPIIAFKGDHEPVNMAKGNTRVTGWRRELLSGTELSFYNTYKDSVSLSIEGNTKVSDEVYREKTGKTVVIPASEHKKANADKVLISGNTVQMSDWYGVNGQSSQYQYTKVMGKNLIDVSLYPEFDSTINGFNSNFPLIVLNSLSNNVTYYVRTVLNVRNNFNLSNNHYDIQGKRVSDGNIVWITGTGTYNLENVYDTIVTKTFTTDFSTYSEYYIRLFPPSGGYTKMYTDIMVCENSIADKSYEPYKDTVKNGLVLEYNGKNFFNNPQTTLLKDRSGNGNHGTPSGFAYNSTSGSDGNDGIVFDGVDDYIDCGNQSSVNFGNSDFTIDVWFKIKSTHYNSCVLFDKYATGKGWFVTIDNGKPRFFINVPNTGEYIFQNIGSTNIPLNTLTHLTISVSRVDVAKAFINGVYVGSIDISSKQGDLNTTRNLHLGYETVDNWKFNGELYSARLYNRALSESEVYQNYMAGTSLNMPSPEDPSPVVSNLPAGTYKYTSKDGIYEFTLDEELRGIDSVTDKVVFDRISKKGILNRTIGRKVFNGNETFAIHTQNNGFTSFYYLLSNYVQNGLVSHFEYSNFTGANMTKECAFLGSNLDRMLFVVKDVVANTVEGFKGWLSQQNSSGNPVVFQYQMKTTTKTSLTFNKVSSSTAPEVPMQFITSEVSPDYPAEMYDVENTKIATRTKNILDATKFQNCRADTTSTWNGSSLTITGNWYDQVLIKVKPNTNYKMSYTKTGTGRDGWGVWTTTNGSNIVSQLSAPNNVFNSKNNTQLLVLLYSGSGSPLTSVYSNIQVEEGSTATPHELVSFRNETTTPLLRKVGTVADTYNPLTGEYVQRVGVKVFDGTEAWIDDFGASGNYYYHNPLGNGHNLTIPSWKCTHALFSTKSNIQNAVNTFHFTTSGSGYFEFSTYKFSSSADMKVWMAQEYSNGTPITIYYYLKTPIVTYLEPNLTPLYDVDTYIESDSAIAQPDITVGYELKDGVTTNINDITEPHPDYPRVIDGVGEYDEVNDDYNLEVYSGVGGLNLLTASGQEYTIPDGVANNEFLTLPFNFNPIFDKYGIDKVYTLSFDMKSKNISKSHTISVYPYPASPEANKYRFPYTTFTNITTEYQRFSISFTPTIGDASKTLSRMVAYGTYGTGNVPAMRNIKLEISSIATPWTPAPEDIQYNTPTNNTFKTLHNFPIEMNRIGDIADEYTPPFWGAGYDGDGRNLHATSRATSISRGTFQKNDYFSSEFTFDNALGNTPYTFFSTAPELTQGETYTISFKIKQNNPVGSVTLRYGLRGSGGHDDKSIVLEQQVETLITHTFRPLTTGAPQLIVYTPNYTSGVSFTVSEMKIERGSTPTPWTPSSGEFVQRIGKRTMTGVETFSIVDGYTGHYRFNMGVPVKPSTNIVCSHFKDGNTGLGANIASVHGSSQLVMFCPSTNLIPSTSKWNDWLTQQYTIGNPVTLYYILNTPVLSTITGSAIPTFFPATKVEVLTSGTKPKLQGTARVVDLLETDF